RRTGTQADLAANQHERQVSKQHLSHCPKGAEERLTEARAIVTKEQGKSEDKERPHSSPRRTEPGADCHLPSITRVPMPFVPREDDRQPRAPGADRCSRRDTGKGGR